MTPGPTLKKGGFIIGQSFLHHLCEMPQKVNFFSGKVFGKLVHMAWADTQPKPIFKDTEMVAAYN